MISRPVPALVVRVVASGIATMRLSSASETYSVLSGAERQAGRADQEHVPVGALGRSRRRPRSGCLITGGLPAGIASSIRSTVAL